MKFRYLRADEVDCKVKMVKQNGVMLLLYKDARCDQNILDEVVGPENWQRKHTSINGNLFCSVGVFIPQMDAWVWKEDVGVESATEAEKGQASDAFKRACFNWGIGRELYTAPFIWIPADKCNISGGKCYDKFVCTKMEVKNRSISVLEIVNANRNNQVVFQYGIAKNYSGRGDTAEDAKLNHEMQAAGNTEKIDAVKIKTIEKEINKKGLTANSILQHYKLTGFEHMTINQWTNAMQLLQQYPDRK